MTHPVHTPYDGSTLPFAIALQPLDLKDWIEVDKRLDVHLGEKCFLFEHQHTTVYQAEPDTDAAQSEVLDLLWTYLPDRYPEIYRTEGDLIWIGQSACKYNRRDWDARPLELASRLVQDDLVIMRAGARGHRLVAASLCFPSSWSLIEKFGHPLADIHAPVPGFQRGTRTAELIERIFTNLQAERPVQRYNWSLYDRPDMHYIERDHSSGPEMWASEDPRAWIRVERQTLRRLPLSGDILFTIKICVDPVQILDRMPDGHIKARSLADQLAGLDDAQTRYKGVAASRDKAVKWLREFAAQK